MKSLVALFVLVSLIGSDVYAKRKKRRINLRKDFNSLNSDQQMREKAKKYDPHNRVRIVQNRKVDRAMRLEIGGNAGLVGGGDANYDTKNLGVFAEFHISNRWSLGARYTDSINTLTADGREALNAARANQLSGNGRNSDIHDIDYVKDSMLGTLSFYPLYGKLNLFDSIVHFDVYTLAGYGVTNLSRGQSSTITGGLGFGIWWAQHLTSRIEARYQTYQDQVSSGQRRLHTVVGQISLGVLF